MTSLDTEARAAIRRGAEYISENGHNKETMFARQEGNTHYPTYEECVAQGASACALGSIIVSTGEMNRVYDHARTLLLQSIQGAYGSGVYMGIVDWNDDPATSAEDVILLMNRVGNEVE